MKLHSRSLLLVLITIVSLSLVSTSVPAQVKGVEHVIVFGVDGLSPNGVTHAKSPNMRWMMANGAYTLHARCTRPTSSSTNWASMMMGAAAEQHGITSNDWERDKFTITPAVTGMEDIFPTIYGVLKSQKPAAVTAAVYDWDGFGRLYEKKAVDIDIRREGPDKTTEAAVKAIVEKKPALMYIQLDHVDHWGHEKGHGTPEYYDAVDHADTLLGKVFEALKTAGIYDNTIVFIIADHGGIGKGHGGDSMAELEIPFMVWGKGVAKNKEITLPVYIYDLAATIAYIYGVEQPYAWTGRPVKTAFAPVQ